MENLVNFYDGCLLGNEVWFSNLNFNALMKMNIKTGETEFVDTFPEISNIHEYIHTRVICYENCLYFVPYKGNMLHIWNYIELKWEKSVYINCSEIENAYLYNDDIWLFPRLLKESIIKFNLKDRKVILLNELTSQINEINSKGVKILSSAISFHNDKLLIGAYEGNTIITIDCKKEQITDKYSFDNVSIAGVKIKDENHFWVWFTNSTNIYLVNQKEKSIIDINTKIKIHYNRIPFSNMINIDDNRALVLPRHTDDILLIDISKKETNKLKIPNEFKRCKTTSLLIFYKKVDELILIFPCGGNGLLIIDTNTMSISYMKFITNEKFLEYAKKMKVQIFNNAICSGNLSEGKGWSKMLPDFLDFVCENNRANVKDDNRNIGNEIVNTIKDIL